MTTKICTRCHQEKDISEFGERRRYSKDGLNSWCKKCNNENSSTYHRKHPERVREYYRKRCEIDPEYSKYRNELHKEYIKKRLANDPEYRDAVRKYQREYKEKHKESLQAAAYCKVLYIHKRDVGDDPERLPTEFINQIVFEGIYKEEG